MSRAVRLELPSNLRVLARIAGEVCVVLDGEVTQRTVLDALEAAFPMLRGTLRDPVSKRRRPFIRFFACEQDFSHAAPDETLPDSVARGVEPLLIVGAIAGG